MAYSFVLPDLGEGIADGEIRKWLVKEGDTIEEHQSVLEIETDKAVVELPSPKGGTVLKIAKEEGEIAKVGEVLMVVGEAGEQVEAPKPAEKKPEAGERPKSVSVAGELPEEEEEVKPLVAAQPKSAPAPKPAEKKPAAGERPKSVSVVGELPEEEEEVKPLAAAQPKSAPVATEATVLAAPAVRAFAKEKGISLDKVKGTGPGGSITREDVLNAVNPEPKAGDQYGSIERVPMRGLRKTIAKNMVFAQHTTAFVTETDEADISDLWDLRAREKKALEDKGVHLTFMPFFMKAVQHALMEFRAFNASMDEERGEIIIKKYYNIGVAVDTDEGLIVTVVRNVDKKTIRELAGELQDLSKQARERTVKLEDLKGSTFTITNYGTYGSTFATPIINYPDVAILGIGKITDKPWVKGGQIVIRKILPLSLTFDHRVNDGAGAAKFLTKLAGYLEDPASLFIESA